MRLRHIASAVALAVTASVVTAPAAEASTESPTVFCVWGPIYTVRQNGELWLFNHADPANGAFSWGSTTRVGTGWGGRTIAGRDRLYNITDSGELRQFKPSASGFEQLPHGGYYDVVGSDWQLYTTPEYRNRIAFDDEGAIYTIDQQGNLRWWFFNTSSSNWHLDSGRILATGWDQFDMITAAGPGALQARRPDGSMTRYRYHQDSRRWMRYDRSSGHGWQMFEKMFSLGGDVLYGVNRFNGDLTWYAYDETTDRWVSDVGRVVGRDWSGLRDITGRPWSCRSKNMAQPQPQLPGGRYRHAPAAIETEAGVLHTFQVKPNGGVVHGTMTEPATFQSRGGAFGMESDELRPHVDSAGNAEVYGVNLDGATVNRWYPDGRPNPYADMPRGYLRSTPAVHRKSNGTVALYGIADGQLWLREGKLPWRPLGVPARLSGSPVVARQSDSSITLLVRNESGRIFEVIHDAAGLGALHEFSGPEIGSEGFVAVTEPSGAVRVFALSKENSVLTAGADRRLRALDGSAKGGLGAGAALGPDGRITVVAENFHGKTERTVQTAPGSDQFEPWQVIGDISSADTNAPLLITRRSGELVMLQEYGPEGTLQYCSLSTQTCVDLD